MCIKLVLFHFSKICHENEIIYNLVTFHFHRIFKNGGGGGGGRGRGGSLPPLDPPQLAGYHCTCFKCI